jgi:hypothetical protein
MFELEQKMKTVLLQYILLKLTYREEFDWRSIDFDDVHGVWDSTLGLEIMPMDMSSYGVEIGLLTRYEDEIYNIDQIVWQTLYDSLNENLKTF